MDEQRKRSQNEARAWQVLEERLRERWLTKQQSKNSKIRNGQHGSGKRGDKKRTYKMQAGVVEDHRSGKRTTAKNILRGKIELLH